MNEQNIIVQKAVEKLVQHTGLQGHWAALNGVTDGVIEFDIDGIPVRLTAEVKKEIRHYQLKELLSLAKQHEPFMIIAEKIFPNIKEILRKNQVGYLDTAGNIYIKTGGNYIFIDGNKPVDEEKPVTNRAFTKTGLRTVFCLLLERDAINSPYRQLAETSGVALGNIKNVMEGLREAGFILQVNKRKMALQNKRALLDRWISGYRETLKPALAIGNFRIWDKNKLLNWRQLPMQPGEMVWGGEPAAEELTGYIKPTVFTVYTDQTRAAIMPRWTLLPDTKGEIQLYKKFWKVPLDAQGYAPPLLVYADLLITDDPRCIETAGMIFNQYLQNEFK